jgi:hypothetical protein
MVILSGLEILLLDGGATVGSIFSASATALGYKQHKDDDAQFLPKAELMDLQLSLKRSHERLVVAHRALTKAWRGPVSLVGEKEMAVARQHGVPSWAIASIEKAQRLADKAAELGHLTDNYCPQFERALQGKGEEVLAKPVRAHLEELDSLSLRISSHAPCLAMSRRAFYSPQEFQGKPLDDREQQIEEDGSLAQDMPIRVSGQRKRLGKMWNSSQEAFQKVQKVLRMKKTRDLERIDCMIDQDPEEKVNPFGLDYTNPTYA